MTLLEDTFKLWLFKNHKKKKKFAFLRLELYKIHYFFWRGWNVSLTCTDGLQNPFGCWIWINRLKLYPEKMICGWEMETIAIKWSPKARSYTLILLHHPLQMMATTESVCLFSCVCGWEPVHITRQIFLVSLKVSAKFRFKPTVSLCMKIKLHTKLK